MDEEEDRGNVTCVSRVVSKASPCKITGLFHSNHRREDRNLTGRGEFETGWVPEREESIQIGNSEGE